MNKTELINAIADKTGMTKTDAAKALDATLSAVIEALKADESVAILGFGTFMAKHKEARMVRNPRTNETFMSSAKKAPTFKAGKAFKDALND